MIPPALSALRSQRIKPPTQTTNKKRKEQRKKSPVLTIRQPFLTAFSIERSPVVAKITARGACSEGLIVDSCKPRMSNIGFVTHGAIDRLYRQSFRVVPLGLAPPSEKEEQQLQNHFSDSMIHSVPTRGRILPLNPFLVGWNCASTPPIDKGDFN